MKLRNTAFILSLTLSLVLGSALTSKAQIVNVLSVSVPAVGLSCVNVSAAIPMQINCNNWVFDSTSFNISNDTIFLGVYYTPPGPICLGALAFPTYNVAMGMVPAANYTVIATGYDALVPVSFAQSSMNISSCCGAAPGISASTTSICPGETVSFVNNSSGDSLVSWYVDNTFITSADSFDHIFPTSGTSVVKLVVIGSGGCSDSTTQNITVNSLPNVNLGPDTSYCENSVFTLDAGSGWVSVVWSNGDSTQTTVAIGTGDYSATVVDANGCVNSDTVNVIEHPAPVFSLGGDTVACIGTPVVLNATTSGSTYLWSTGSTDPTLSVTANGGYSVTVTGAGGCSSWDSVYVLFTLCNGLDDQFSSDLVVHPNPAQDFVIVSLEKGAEENLEFTISSSEGKIVKNGSINAGSKESRIEIEGLNPGIYYIRISNSTESISRKLVIE